MSRGIFMHLEQAQNLENPSGKTLAKRGQTEKKREERKKKKR